MRWSAKSLFARTALLLAAMICAFSVIAWQAIVWTAIEPAAELAVNVLKQRADTAIVARRTGGSLPEGARFEAEAPSMMEPRFRGFALGGYVATIRTRLQASMDASEVRVHRIAIPSEIWVRTREVPDAWLVLTWRVAGPKAQWAAAGVLSAAALLVLGGAAWSARRLTAPLASLAAAVARFGEGNRVEVDAGSGPEEVRSLAVAFQSMSQRLAELDQQRELMLGGISHDLRTPLARLRVAVELLDGGDNALTQEMTANIEEMDRMVAQFLHYVRANYRESPVRVSLDDVVRQTLEIYATDERIHLDLNARESRGLMVSCIRHTILNLVQNALEYGRPPIGVRTSNSDAAIRIEVLDSGAGLSETEWADAIRPFHRPRDQPSAGHTGLGLAMVDRLVQVCGGSLCAKRTANGFSVAVVLPAPRVGDH